MGKKDEGKGPNLTLVGGATDATSKGGRKALTSKQLRFVSEIIRGASQADAYRRAYDASKMSPGSIYSESCILMTNPQVAARLREHERSIERSALSSALSRRQMILDGLEREAALSNEDGGSPGSRVRALELLGKSTGVDLFVDRVEQVTDESPDELRSELEDRLRSLLGKQG